MVVHLSILQLWTFPTVNISQKLSCQRAPALTALLQAKPLNKIVAQNRHPEATRDVPQAIAPNLHPKQKQTQTPANIT